MLHVIKNADVYSPEYMGICDVIVTGNQILSVNTPSDDYSHHFSIFDAEGAILAPGFVDGLVHIIGGGGEGGFGNRTTEITAAEMLRAGVTTAVGALGTDAITRSVENLLGKSRELSAQGVCTYFFTGSYHLPLCSIMGNVEKDILFLPEVLGVGELALSDHRGSVIEFKDLYSIARQVRTTANLAGKQGVILCHLGDENEKLDLLSKLTKDTELPNELFWPTHINRNPHLFEAGVQYALSGGYVDLTTSTNEGLIADGEVVCARGLSLMLNAGVLVDRITFTSDANASLPRFDAQGKLVGTDSGRIDSLFDAVKQAVTEYDIPFETALRCITSNPASRLGLTRKGSITAGNDADLLLINPEDLSIQQVWTNGSARL